MSTYRGIRGTLVSTRTSNPDNPNTGDIWYRSDTGDVQLQVNLGSWAAGGNMNSARGYQGAAGTQTSALAISGAPTPPFGGRYSRHFINNVSPVLSPTPLESGYPNLIFKFCLLV